MSMAAYAYPEATPNLPYAEPAPDPTGDGMEEPDGEVSDESEPDAE
jgi:hypothetical protein